MEPTFRASDRRSPSNGRLIAIAAIAAAVLLVVCAIGVGLVLAIAHNAPRTVAAPKGTPSPRSAGPVTEASILTADMGRVIFTDDFKDSLSGWAMSSTPNSVSYSYANGGYLIAATGAFDYYANSPYLEPHQQLSMSVTATQLSDTPPDAGFGVTCASGMGNASVMYQLLAFGDGTWSVERRDGTDAADAPPHTIRTGSTAARAAGGPPVTVVGVCATLSDGRTTRLALFVAGTMVTDVTDVSPSPPTAGWLAAIDVAGSDVRPSTLFVTHFEERSLGAVAT